MDSKFNKMPTAPMVPVMCFFCKSKFEDSELETHMREEHQMMSMFRPVPKVKCIFCREGVDEKEMEKHIRVVHKVFGLQLNYEQAETSTQTYYGSMSPDVSMSKSFMDDSDVDEKEELKMEKKRIEENETTKSDNIETVATECTDMIKSDDKKNKSIKEVPTRKKTAERYRCSSCDFHHNKLIFLKRHIKLEHRNSAKDTIPVKQTMRVVMQRKPMEKVIDKDSKEKLKQKTARNNTDDVKVVAINPDNQTNKLLKAKQKTSNQKWKKAENNEKSTDSSNNNDGLNSDTDTNSDIEILFEHFSKQPPVIKTSNKDIKQTLEPKETVSKELESSPNHSNEPPEDLEECLFCQKKVAKSLIEVHITKDHKIGLTSAVAKLLDIHNTKTQKSEESKDDDFTGENPFGISFYPVLDEIADNEDLVNQISFSAPGVMDQVYLPSSATPRPSVSRFRCPSCEFYNGKMYLVIEHIMELHNGYRRVENESMNPIKQEMKIFLGKINNKDKTVAVNNKGKSNDAKSESESEMEHMETISIEDLSSENETSKANSLQNKTGKEDDDFIEVVYESVNTKSEHQRKNKKVKFSFNEINSFYRCKKKPKDNSSQLLPTSGKDPKAFSILKNDSILKESMQYWADSIDKSCENKQNEKSPYLLDPGLCDDISLTIFGVRFRCPSCLLHDDKLRVVREHIIEAHQGFHQGDVDSFIDCLEPMKQTMKVGLVNVSQIEIEKMIKEYDAVQTRQQEKENAKAVSNSNGKGKRKHTRKMTKKYKHLQKRKHEKDNSIQAVPGSKSKKGSIDTGNMTKDCEEHIENRQHTKEYIKAVANSRRKKKMTESWIMNQDSTEVKKRHISKKLQSDDSKKESSHLGNSQAQISVPDKQSTSESSSLHDANADDVNYVVRDIEEVCQIVEDIENNWKDSREVMDEELSLDEFEKKIFLEGDNTNWNTSLSDRLSMTSSITSSDLGAKDARKIFHSGSDTSGSSGYLK